MNLRCHLTFLGRIERNKNSSGKRASSSASQINLSFILTQATTLLNPPPFTHSLKQIKQSKQTKNTNDIMPILLRKRTEPESQYLYKLCIKIDNKKKKKNEKKLTMMADRRNDMYGSKKKQYLIRFSKIMLIIVSETDQKVH